MDRPRGGAGVGRDPADGRAGSERSGAGFWRSSHEADAQRLTLALPDASQCAWRLMRGSSRRRLTLMSQATEVLIVDVDTGIDDALALLYALAPNACAARRRVDGGGKRQSGGRNPQQPGGSRARRIGGHSRVAGRGGPAVERRGGRPPRPRRERPRPRGSAGPARARAFRARRRRDSRRGARARRPADPRRHRPAHQHRARRHARARAAEPGQAVRHHGRRLSGAGQRDAMRRVQHLARPGGGAHRLPRLRRRRRRAGRRRRARRDAQDDIRRKGRRRIAVRARGCAPRAQFCASSRTRRASISSGWRR